MSFRADFHTHTRYCDGKNTPDEMAARAYGLGFNALGFSGHGVSLHPETSGMSRDAQQRYIADVTRLKREYEGRMDILLGIEQDYDSDEDLSPFEYVIGSVHLLEGGDGLFPLDLSASDITVLINTYYGGDFESLAEAYFSKVATLPERIDLDVIGHIDLISKFKDIISLPMGERYYRAAEAAVRALIPCGKPFEINVGAISRGYRTAPYPDPRILNTIRELGGDIMINGDCHSAATLGDHLDMAIEYAKACGFTHRTILTSAGAKRIEL